MAEPPAGIGVAFRTGPHDKGKGHTMTRETTTSTRAAKRVRGTVPYEDQTISTRAIALLAGQQHARTCRCRGAGQAGARLSVVWGTLLLGFPPSTR